MSLLFFSIKLLSFYTETSKAFTEIGSRGINGQSSSSGVDRNSIMFYTQVHKDQIGCWDTKKPYTIDNLGVVESNTSLIQFPNDLKVDRQMDQGVWVMSNRLPIFLYSELDYKEINFQILRAGVKEAVKGTTCDRDVVKRGIAALKGTKSSYFDNDYEDEIRYYYGS